MTDDDLRAEIARLKRLVLALAERVTAQAELLARRAERREVDAGTNGDEPMAEKRNWLILSLRQSTGDWLVWYRTAYAHYTASLIHAGRYTEAEAMAEQERVPHCVLAVNLDHAVERLAGQMVLRNDKRTVNRLKRLSAKARRESTAGTA